MNLDVRKVKTTIVMLRLHVHMMQQIEMGTLVRVTLDLVEMELVAVKLLQKLLLKLLLKQQLLLQKQLLLLQKQLLMEKGMKMLQQQYDWNNKKKVIVRVDELNQLTWCNKSTKIN